MKTTEKTSDYIKKFNEYFRNNYSYIQHSLTDKQVADFLNQSYVKNSKIENQADLFSDYLLSQNLADVQQ